MPLPNVLKNPSFAIITRTCGVLMLLWATCGCKRKAEIPNELATPPSLGDLDASIVASRSNCIGQKDSSTPILFAHFLETSLKDNVQYSDILENKIGAIDCAPGPFALEQKKLLEMPENVWTFSRMPAYFVWDVGNQTSSDAGFLITNQAGFPLGAQVNIRVQKNKDSLLILLPKTNLSLDTTYYLYLTMETKQGTTTTWIQPIMIPGSDQEID